jgi:hypothetical protein
MKFRLLFYFSFLLTLVIASPRFLQADVEVEGWGDLRGFRLDGQLFPITTSIRIVAPGGKQTAATGHWQERELKFSLDGNRQIFSGKFGFRRPAAPIDYQTVVQPLGANSAKIDIEATAEQDVKLERMEFTITVPLADFAGAAAKLDNSPEPATQPVPPVSSLADSPAPNSHSGNSTAQIATTQPATERVYLEGAGNGIQLQAGHKTLKVDFDSPREILVRDHHDPKGDQLTVSVTIHSGNLVKGEKVDADFTVTTAGDIDHQPATVVIDSSHPGSRFDGIGGNFAFSLDSPDVKYNLDHLPIIWARMAMPLATWEPDEMPDPDPQSLAVNDKPDTQIRQTLELARQLTQRHIPLIFTLWVAPSWAMTHPQRRDLFAEGQTVNPKKWDELCNAIASFLLYARQHYGVEPKYFSLNETDIGITIHLTPLQYREALKRIGACFASHGISTRFLLGDVSKPPPVDFIKPATLDPEALHYVRAVSFHSWNGFTPQQLTAWHDVSQRLDFPLFVAEGGTDSDSYHYPHVWAYPWYAIDEAGMYLDLLCYAQPNSVLPWEMTPDYGLVDFSGPAPRPTLRFWCLKQLATTTHPGARELPVAADNSAIHCAALFDADSRSFCVHLANIGAQRHVTISGIPSGITSLQSYVTDEGHPFAMGDPAAVQDGIAEINLPALSYLTLSTQENR